jgi:hypothetical protein
VTVLTTLSNADKARLLANGVTLCTMIRENPSLLAVAGISGRKADAAILESKAVCEA